MSIESPYHGLSLGPPQIDEKALVKVGTIFTFIYAFVLSGTLWHPYLLIEHQAFANVGSKPSPTLCVHASHTVAVHAEQQYRHSI